MKGTTGLLSGPGCPKRERKIISMNFNVAQFLDTLPIMGKGMVGIFIVAGVIILSMYALNYFSSGVGKKK